MTASIEAMAREAGLIHQTNPNPNPYAGASQAPIAERLTRFAALVRAQALEDAALFLEAHSLETYGVALREHNEAAEWLRALPPSE